MALGGRKSRLVTMWCWWGRLQWVRRDAVLCFRKIAAKEMKLIERDSTSACLEEFLPCSRLRRLREASQGIGVGQWLRRNSSGCNGGKERGREGSKTDRRVRKFKRCSRLKIETRSGRSLSRRCHFCGGERKKREKYGAELETVWISVRWSDEFK